MASVPNLLSKKLFADDTKLYREIIDPDDCQEIQEDLNTLSAWSKIWLLGFNETKCIVLRLSFVERR
jgi:hypothetical protein